MGQQQMEVFVGCFGDSFQYVGQPLRRIGFVQEAGVE